jgi:hypothetical protein
MHHCRPMIQLKIIALGYRKASPTLVKLRRVTLVFWSIGGRTRRRGPETCRLHRSPGGTSVPQGRAVHPASRRRRRWAPNGLWEIMTRRRADSAAFGPIRSAGRGPCRIRDNPDRSLALCFFPNPAEPEPIAVGDQKIKVCAMRTADLDNNGSRTERARFGLIASG